MIKETVKTCITFKFKYLLNMYYLFIFQINYVALYLKNPANVAWFSQKYQAEKSFQHWL